MARLLRVFHRPLALGALELRGEAFAYAAVVHRARVGHEVELFDGEGNTARGTFTGFSAESAQVSVTELAAAGDELRPVRLVQCLGKGDKVDEVLRDACELGLSHFVVAEASRSVRKLDDGAGAKLRDRLGRIAAEAARQAHSPHVASVVGPIPLKDALASTPDPLRVFLDPRGAVPLFEALASHEPSSPLALAVGPEGGFTDEERADALARGWQSVRLGGTVLRTETMAAAVLGAVRAYDDADPRAR